MHQVVAVAIQTSEYGGLCMGLVETCWTRVNLEMLSHLQKKAPQHLSICARPLGRKALQLGPAGHDGESCGGPLWGLGP